MIDGNSRECLTVVGYLDVAADDRKDLRSDPVSIVLEGSHRTGYIAGSE